MTAIEWVEFQQVQACGGQGIRYCMEECPLRPDCVWRMRAGIARLERGRRVSEQVSEAAEAFFAGVGDTTGVCVCVEDAERGGGGGRGGWGDVD
jgi:hypothetical protein